MKRQRAEISSNVISHIKSAHPIEMWRSNKLGIKEKISRGNFPRLIFSCPVPSGLPHRSHCVPMNMNPWDYSAFGAPARARTGGLGLRSMTYHVIHGSDVTSNIIPYAEWLVVNELYGAKHLFWRSFMCPLGGPISKFLARGHPAKADCYCHSPLP